MLKLLSGIVFALMAATPVAAGDSPLKGYSHDNNKIDMFGYYQPVKPLKVGKFRLDHLSIASPQDLTSYEKGKGRLPTWAPVMFQFSDLSSKKMVNEEMGGEYYANAPRVLPAAYRIKGNTIAFEGTDKQVGLVRFAGTFNMSLCSRRRSNPSLPSRSP